MSNFDPEQTRPIPQEALPENTLFQPVVLSPTDIQVMIPQNVFLRSAWNNLAQKHFINDFSAINLISKTEEQYSATKELGEHYYEAINCSKTQAKHINQEQWMRFLLNGPDLDFSEIKVTTPAHPVQLAFVNILFSATCLCRAEMEGSFVSKHYQRWEEAAFVTCAHAIINLNNNYNTEQMLEELPLAQLDDLIETQIRISHDSPRLQNALATLSDKIPTIQSYYNEKVAKFGKLGDKLFALSSEQIGDRTSTTQKNNLFLLRIQEELKDRISQDLWRSADDQIKKLICPEGGHLCCEIDRIFKSENVQKAALGLIREVNRDADLIILTGSEWTNEIVSADSKKRDLKTLKLIIEDWINASNESDPLPKLLGIKVDSELLDSVFTFYRRLKETQLFSKAKIELNINPDLREEQNSKKQVLIVGPKIWESYFLTSSYQSALLIETQSENRLDLTIPMETNSGVKYLQAAAGAVAENQGCGPWKTAYIPGSILPEVSNAIGWEAPEKQFSKLFRVANLNPNQTIADHFHNHYIFVHFSRGERARHQPVVPSDELVLR